MLAYNSVSGSLFYMKVVKKQSIKVFQRLLRENIVNELRNDQSLVRHKFALRSLYFLNE
jgi:hypothetical protein